MPFNPANYKPPEPKPLPVVLLLDVSGSMSGDKINCLNAALREMIDSFAREEQRETVIHVAIITFGSQVNLLTPYTPVRQLIDQGVPTLEAGGMTPMGTALRMAKDMIEDRDTTPSRAYIPAVLLMSDGEPNDDWRGPLEAFIGGGRSAKCERFGVPVGADADRDVIRMFAQDDDYVFEAANAEDIASVFKKVTMTVSTRARSKDPNAIPAVAQPTAAQPAAAPAWYDDDMPEF